MSQKARVHLYAVLSALLFVGIFLLGDWQWISFVGVGALLLAAALERCPSCRQPLLVFGATRLPETGQFVCRDCWTAGGERPGGPADPTPPRP